MPFTAWKLFLMYPSCISKSDCLSVCLQLLLYICTFFSFCLAVYIVFFRHSHFPLKCLRALRVQAINRSINRWLSDWLIDRFRWTDKWMDRWTGRQMMSSRRGNIFCRKNLFKSVFLPNTICELNRLPLGVVTILDNETLAVTKFSILTWVWTSLFQYVWTGVYTWTASWYCCLMALWFYQGS